MGLRYGEIRGLVWENYNGEEMHVTRSIWNGKITDPKTRKGRAPVPVIRQLAERLEMHRLRCGNPQTGPIFANAKGNPLAIVSLTNRLIFPSLNRCGHCWKAQMAHQKATHEYKRDARIPEWHGWHAARPWKQSLSVGCTGYGDSAHPPSREREHDGNLLHQDSRRRCPQRHDEAGKSHCGGSAEPSGH